jgi:hypothetical protein
LREPGVSFHCEPQPIPVQNFKLSLGAKSWVRKQGAGNWLKAVAVNYLARKTATRETFE